MKETRKYGSKEITIEDGKITVNNNHVGYVNQAFQYGYHPSIKLEFNNGTTLWFELDDEPLEKVFDTVRKETY